MRNSFGVPNNENWCRTPQQQERQEQQIIVGKGQDAAQRADIKTIGGTLFGAVISYGSASSYRVVFQTPFPNRPKVFGQKINKQQKCVLRQKGTRAAERDRERHTVRREMQ